MAKDKKILYFYPVRMSFVAKDIDILKKRYQVSEYHFNARDKFKIPFNFVRQLIFLLSNIRTTSVIMCFFAGYHSFFPAIIGKLFRRPVIIFLGGADVYRYPEFSYGHFNKFMISKFTCLSSKLASLLVPVDDCLIYSESDYYHPDYSKQGIRYFCPNLKTPAEVIALEYDPAFFYARSGNRPANSFITAGFGIEGPTFVRKGIDLIIEVAGTLPDCEFTVLGCSSDVIKIPFTPNVNFIPPVPYERLAEIYSRHRFYLQLSIAEGFPSAICEAMLCECVPIGSKVAAIPHIIGDTGFILEKRDVSLLKGLLEKVLLKDDLPQYGQKARQRIIENFYPGTRSKKMYDLIENFSERRF